VNGSFVVLVRANGEPVGPGPLAQIQATVHRNRMPPLTWSVDGDCAAGVGPDVAGAGVGPLLVHTEHYIVVGNARLDNRDEVLGWVKLSHDITGFTDLAIIACAIEERGVKCIPDLLGEFAIAAWNPARRVLTAARDSFGIKPLFYRRTKDLIAVGSRATLLDSDEAYDLDYIADFLMGISTAADRTIFAGTSAVPPAGIATMWEGQITIDRYWSPADFVVDYDLAPAAAAECLRDLINRGVAQCLTGRPDTWAQLSGGIDSSSIVCCAQWLNRTRRVPVGLSGTVTLVDTLGSGDERPYSDAVARHASVRNETIADCWLWQADEVEPPMTDEPALPYPLYVRDRRMAAIVGDAGGRVLLNGTGPDHFLAGSPLFVADMVAQGRMRAAARELAAWSAVTRGSFWSSAYRYSLSPLLPSVCKIAPSGAKVPPWIEPGFARRFRLAARSAADRGHTGRFGQKYAGDIAHRLGRLSRSFDRGVTSDRLEVRYPFLYRPLVEFSLRLPPPFTFRPRGRKWLLRESMKGVLPEVVRARSGKGGLEGRIVWSLHHERHRLQALLRAPILEELGCIRPRVLKSALSDGQLDDVAVRAHAISALSLESWLCVRSGRWTGLSAAR
jgi:asparagine synthase (glutamine-hydrolysing)